MLNYKPKLAEVNPDYPNAWARCDRCGFITNIDKMVWQFDFRGTPQPINTRVLTCGRETCLDQINPQDSPIILSPDPEPVFNARPYPYTLSETSWLFADDGDVLITEDGSPLITPIPNPSLLPPDPTDLTTEGGDPLVTQDDNNIVADNPNPYDFPDYGDPLKPLP